MGGRSWCLVAALFCSACAPYDDAPSGPAVAISVAPLSYPGVTNATFALEVRNRSGEVVFQRALDSLGYGAGDGSLSYVGPCDAGAGENPNVVALTLTGLYAGTGGASLIAPTTYDNPGPLERSFDCLANADVAVAFDLTIARQANQGFFDIAVSFSDVYCSAKLDCLDDQGRPLALLFDGTGARKRTVVLGLACTADLAVGGETWLYRSPVTVTCAAGTAVVDPSAGPGNLSAGAGVTATGTSPLFGAAVYRGAEQLGFNKRYWNVLLGVYDTAATCTVTARATASPEPFTLNATPAGTTWPVIVWNVPITGAGGALACTTHPVNGAAPHAGVATAYSGLTTPETFAFASGPTVPTTTVTQQAGFRQWSDGTYAASCDAYRNPAAVPYSYTGATGDGVYRLQDGTGTFDAWCEMDQQGGGWTLVMKSVNDRWTYDDALWTTVGTLNPSDWALTTAGRAKYPAFDRVPFQIIRSTDPAAFDTGFAYDFGTSQPSARARFAMTGFQIGTSIESYWNSRAPAFNQQWGCTDYTSYGFNTRDYGGSATHIAGGSYCDWNGWARWGQRVNQSNGSTGNHGGQGWGAESSIGNPYTIAELMWVR